MTRSLQGLHLHLEPTSGIAGDMAVAALVDCDAIEDVAVKGFAAPVRVWRVKSLRAEGAAPAAAAFVGRRAELAQFSAIVEACRASGAGQTIGVRYGEGFVTKEPLVIEDVAGLAGGASI